MKFKMK